MGPNPPPYPQSVRAFVCVCLHTNGINLCVQLSSLLVRVISRAKKMSFIFLIFHTVFVHFFNNAVLYISKRKMIFLISLIVVKEY